MTLYELWINVAKSGSAEQLFVKSPNIKLKKKSNSVAADTHHWPHNLHLWSPLLLLYKKMYTNGGSPPVLTDYVEVILGDFHQTFMSSSGFYTY